MEALGMRVKCLLAVCTQSALEEILSERFSLPVPSYLAPPTVAPLNRDADQPLVAIGTLDIQVSHSSHPTLTTCRFMVAAKMLYLLGPF